MRTKQGFSLVELLVVIAIIGVLASIVLASLNEARDKGGDAAVKANLSNLRSQAGLYYDQNSNSYGPGTGTSCTTAGSVFTDSRVTEQITAAQNASGGSVATCANSTTKWVVAVPLRTDKTKSWCVDDSGASKQAAADTTNIKCQ